VLPRLPSNEKNSSDHHNSYNKGPNLAFFSFTESPSNSLPSIKFPKNHITSSYHSNMPETAKAKIWPLGTLGVKNAFKPTLVAGWDKHCLTSLVLQKFNWRACMLLAPHLVTSHCRARFNHQLKYMQQPKFTHQFWSCNWKQIFLVLA
jgi:hypothetical protein